MAEGTALRGDEAPVTEVCKPRPQGPLWGMWQRGSFIQGFRGALSAASWVSDRQRLAIEWGGGGDLRPSLAEGGLWVSLRGLPLEKSWPAKVSVIGGGGSQAISLGAINAFLQPCLAMLRVSRELAGSVGWAQVPVPSASHCLPPAVAREVA